MSRYGYEPYGEWPPYVSVAERKRKAAIQMEALRKKGVDIQPIAIEGRKIASSFWGKGWCDHLESFSDYSNRLPRGRSYVRNGSVCHLAIAKGKIEAKVSGSSMYDVEVSIKVLPSEKWKTVKARCGGRIGSLLELLQGRLSDEVMLIVTDRKEGLFPLPGEISLRCSCPDSARMCKHVAAVLYGVGSRLDNRPELLFLLRGVNHDELIEADAEKAVSAATSRGTSKRLAPAALGDVFGIDIDAASSEETAVATTPASPQATNKKAASKTRATKTVKAKPTVEKAKVKKKAAKKTAAKTIVKKRVAPRKIATAPADQ
jgi:uncharacterized Zn finger protein